jgi:GNAT superfamily N-acetyltransferase
MKFIAPGYTITRAIREDIPFLSPIELAAASLLAGYAPFCVLQETTSDAEFEEARSDGRLWVVRASGAPVGFALSEILEPTVAHLKEIDVHPDHVRRGLGTQLVLTACNWAQRERYESLTLTTFRHVPFNMPFYARLGFEVIPDDELSPQLRSVLFDESRRGLDPNHRVAMRRLLRVGVRRFTKLAM